jgi:MFS family permease
MNIELQIKDDNKKKENIQSDSDINQDIVINENRNFETKKKIIPVNMEEIEANVKSIKYFKSYLLGLNPAGGFFFFGYNLGIFNILQSFALQIFGWEKENETLLISICSTLVPIGALFGAIIAGKIAGTKIGRRGSLILLNFIGLLGNLISIIGGTPAFIIGRLIVGFVSGAFSTIVPLYIKEYLPISIQAKGLMINNTFFAIGVLMGFCLGLNLTELNTPGNSWWRFMLCFPSLIGFINCFFLFIIYKYETPKFLVLNKDDPESARKALSFIYYDESEIELQINNLKELKKFFQENAEAYDIKFSDLIGPKYKIRFIISIIFNIGQQMSAINVMSFYSNFIYNRYEPEINATIYSLYFGISEVIGNIIAVFIVEKMGRRLNLLIGFFGGFLCLLSMSILYYLEIYSPQKFIIIVYFIFGGMSIDPIIWIINVDLLPDLGAGTCATVNWIFVIVVVISFPYMEKAILLSGVFLLYSVCTLFVCIFMVLFFKETKNKSEIEITKNYSKWF